MFFYTKLLLVSLCVITINHNPNARVKADTVPESVEKMSVPTFDRKSNSDRIFYYHGILFLDFKEPGANIDLGDTLKRLLVSIRINVLGILQNGVILLHNNTRPHVAQIL